MMEQFTADTFPPMFRQMYDALSPDGPEHFPVFFDEGEAELAVPGRLARTARGRAVADARPHRRR